MKIRQLVGISISFDVGPENYGISYLSSLEISPVDNGWEVSWDDGVLQSAADIDGPWQDVPLQSPVKLREGLIPSIPTKFFRVRADSQREVWKESGYWIQYASSIRGYRRYVALMNGKWKYTPVQTRDDLDEVELYNFTDIPEDEQDKWEPTEENKTENLKENWEWVLQGWMIREGNTKSPVKETHPNSPGP